MASTDIVIAESVADLVLPDAENASLLQWLLWYGEHEVAGSPAGTIDAKRRDLERFYNWFQQTLRSDDVDLWTSAFVRVRDLVVTLNRYSGIMSRSRTACHVPVASRVTGRMAMTSGATLKIGLLRIDCGICGSPAWRRTTRSGSS